MLLTSRPWLTLIPLLLLIWLGHFFVDSMLGIWHVYKSMAQLDLGKAGLIVAVGAFIGEGSQLFFGSLSDKGYRRLLIIIGLVGTAASAFLAYTTSYMALFGLYLITCIGSGCFHPASASLMSSLDPTRRGLLMTIFSSGGFLGLAASQLLFTHVHTTFSGETMILAFPVLALILLFFITRIPTQASGRTPTQTAHKLTDLFNFFKKSHFRLLYISQVANQSILWGTIFILPDVLKMLGFSQWICFGGGHFFFILGGASIMIPAGYLADRYSARQVMIYAGLISIVAFYTLIFWGGFSTLVAMITLFILGSTLSLMNPLAVALGARYEPQRTGAVSAYLMGLVWCVSEALGPGSVGLMSTLFTDYAPVKALAVLGSLFLVQIYTTILLPQEEAVAEVPLTS